MLASSPGCPLVENDCQPATVPCNAFDTLETCEAATSFLSITLAEPVKVDFLAVPYGTAITTSSMAIEDSFKSTLMTFCPFTGISTVSYPMNENTSVLFASTCSE